jgi:chromosome partitioning protein
MEIIAFISQKGGVGKTTCSTNVAYCLSQMGYKVLLADLDPQGNSTLLFNKKGTPLFITSLFSAKGADIYDIICKAYGPKEDEIKDLWILPSSIRLALAAEQAAGRVHREKIFSKHLKSLEGFDFVILDCPPTLGLLSINGIYAANKFVVPVDYSRYAMEGMSDLIGVIYEVKEITPPNILIIRNKRDSRNSVTNRAIEGDLNSYGMMGWLAKAVIRKDESINQAQMNGEAVLSFNPKGHGSVDFVNLTKEILEWCEVEKV